MRETDENEWNVYIMRELLYPQVKNSSIIISHQVISWYIHIHIHINVIMIIRLMSIRVKS
jgi:hypothetical protein